MLADRIRELRENVAPGSTEEARTPGDRLVLARNHARMSQKDLAEKSGISVNAIIGFENGRTHPRPRTLMALAEAVGIPWESLKEEEHETEEA